MESSTSLHTLSVVVAYLAWSGIASGCSLILARFADSARRRFQIWLASVIGLLACWVLLQAFPLLLSYTPSTHVIPHRAYAIAHVHAASLSVGGFDLLARIMQWADWIYMAGLVVFATRVGLRLARARKVLKHAQPPSSEIREIFRQVRGFDNYRGCTIHLLPGLSSPATIGWIRPRILLPDFCATDPNDNATEEAVRHELKHIQRRDALWSALAQLAGVVLWFNPAIWLSLSRMHVEREFACDEELVTDMPSSRESYAECLVYFARMRSARHVGPIIGLTSPPTLTHRRILAILTPPAQSGISTRLARTMASITMLLLLPIGLAGLRFDFYRRAQFLSSTMIPPIRALAPLYVHTNHDHRDARVAALRHQVSQKAAELTGVAISPAPPNEKLMAEHRTALDILTYSTMGDASDSATARQETPSEGRVGADTTSRPDVSWKSVAINTAQAVVGAMHGGRDRDDH